jgi:hypothetical protein
MNTPDKKNTISNNRRRNFTIGLLIATAAIILACNMTNTSGPVVSTNHKSEITYPTLTPIVIPEESLATPELIIPSVPPLSTESNNTEPTPIVEIPITEPTQEDLQIPMSPILYPIQSENFEPLGRCTAGPNSSTHAGYAPAIDISLVGKDGVEGNGAIIVAPEVGIVSNEPAVTCEGHDISTLNFQSLDGTKVYTFAHVVGLYANGTIVLPKQIIGEVITDDVFNDCSEGAHVHYVNRTSAFGYTQWENIRDLEFADAEMELNLLSNGMVNVSCP